MSFDFVSIRVSGLCLGMRKICDYLSYFMSIHLVVLSYIWLCFVTMVWENNINGWIVQLFYVYRVPGTSYTRTEYQVSGLGFDMCGGGNGYLSCFMSMSILVFGLRYGMGEKMVILSYWFQILLLCITYALSLKGPRRSTGGFESRIALVLCKHHDHFMNPKVSADFWFWLSVQVIMAVVII